MVKHANPRATDAFSLYTAGQTKIHQGLLKDGYELISEALALLNNVYGAMHPEIAQCLRMLARLNYIMGEFAEALSLQQKATLMSERVLGIDHPYTLAEYTSLALYAFANQQVSVSLKLLYHARYLLLLLHGETHPEVALLDANIGLILHAVGQYSLSLQFLEKSLELNKRFYGEQSLKVALSYHLVARTQSCMGDFRSALRHEKETFGIYAATLGPEHDKTKEADECLRHLTQQAVQMAKKINEASAATSAAYQGRGGGSSSLGLPPIQIQAPSMSSVLELLNIINGILYVQITPQEIERVRAELERGHAEASEAAGDVATKQVPGKALKEIADATPTEKRPVKELKERSPSLDGTEEENDKPEVSSNKETSPDKPEEISSIKEASTDKAEELDSNKKASPSNENPGEVSPKKEAFPDKPEEVSSNKEASPDIPEEIHSNREASPSNDEGAEQKDEAAITNGSLQAESSTT